jgi:type I restriction enzyme, S subunit
LIRLRFSSDISPIYANYYFNSEYFRKTQIEPQIDQQCGQANFSGWKLKETKFLYYPLLRQQEIVAHLDTVFDKSKTLRSEYESQIRDLEVLKQSLLEEAFAGRLVSE